MKSKIIGIVLIIVISVMAAGISYAISPKEQAKITVEESLPWLIKSMAPLYREYNYTSESAVAKTVVGDPIEAYNVDPNSYDPNKPLDQQVAQLPFYTVPLKVDDRVVTSLTVFLKNGQWEIGDFGGDLGKSIVEISSANDLTSSRILNFGHNRFVIAEKGDSLVGFSPQKDYGPNLKKRTVVPIEALEKTLVEKQKEYLMNSKIEGKGLLGSSEYANPNIEFKQDSALNRLVKYVTHALHQ